MKKALLIFAFTYSSVLCAAAVENRGFEVTRHRSGLELVWIPEAELPLFDLVWLQRVGTRQDPPRKSGTGVLLSEMLERGAGTRTGSEWSETLDRLAAHRSVQIDDEMLTVNVSGFSQDSAVLQEALESTVFRPRWDADEFREEKSRVLESWAHLEDSAERVAGLALDRELLKQTSYARGGIWSGQELAKITLEDVKKFHKVGICPARATLVILGRFDRSQVMAWLDHAISASACASAPKPEKISLRIPLKRLLVNRSDAPQVQVRYGVRIPKVTQIDDSALTLASTAFGEMFESRLNSRLRDELGLTYGVSSQAHFQKEMGTFVIAGATSPDRIDRFVSEVERAIDELSRGELSEELIEKARAFALGSFWVQHPSTTSWVSSWFAARELGLGEDYLERRQEKLRNVGPERVSKLARSLFPPSSAWAGVLVGDVKALRTALGKSRAKRWSEWKVKDLR